MTARKFPTAYSILLIGFFLTILSAPAIKMIISDNARFSFTEKRSLTGFPAFPEAVSQVDTYFSDVGRYLDDHFGFRDFLIYRYQREVRKRFGTTGDETGSHQGLANWYYLGQSELLLDYAGKVKVSNSRLEEWVSQYNQKKQWLEDKGINYLLVVPPNKQSVYPEYVMEAWQEVQGDSKLQQLLHYHPKLNNSAVLNLAPHLQQFKSEPLYYKSDTHWTPFGAYKAYLKIAERVEQLFPSASFKKDFTFTELQQRACSPEGNSCGDLTKMVLDFEPFEESFRDNSKFTRCAKSIHIDYNLSNLAPAESTPSFIRGCPRAKLTAIVFRDSFFVSLEPYFSENFSQIIYLWKEYDQKNVEEILRVFKPDIVIEEVVERNFLIPH